MPQYKLTYFNIRARAEVSRMLFAMADQPYEDNRVTGDSWQAFKPKSPLGQLPCLEVDGQMFCQSHAIERYLARKFGFYGDSDLEQLKADMVVDTIEEILKPIGQVFRAPEEDKPKARETYLEETVKPMLTKIEKFVNNNGFMVSNKVTWADVAVFSILENMEGFQVPVQSYVEEKLPKLKSIQDKVAKEPKIAAWIEKRPKSTM